MQFIDYLTLMLINMVAGLVLLAIYLVFGLTDTNQKRWIPGFLLTGLIAFLFGVHMTLTGPLPSPFNTAYGELSVLFGALFLGLAVSLMAGWDLLTLGIYGFFAGLVAVVVGVRIIHAGLSAQPLIAGVGFILTGLSGIFATPALTLWRTRLPIRILGALLLLAAAGIWALTGYLSYWMHLAPRAG